MKTQILSRSHAPISIIGFLLLVTTTLIGCRVFVNRVIGSDTVLLTLDDLYVMGLRKSGRIGRHLNDLSPIKKLSVIAGFEHGWSGGDLNIQYWLFDSASTAKKMAADGARWTCAAMPVSQLELNPENVIGDATWRGIFTRNRSKWGNGLTTLWFVKYNLLVSVRPDEHLQDTRDVARKIEARIEAVLLKK